MPSLIIRPRAQTDIDDALAWYHRRDPDAGARLIVELDVVFERVCENPAQFPFTGDQVQRALLRKFPYSVYFVVVGELAAVIAVLHQRRKPVDWKPRIGAG